jgi:hypothetical protein
MTARAPRIQMAGTAPEGRGAVAALAALMADGFARAIVCLCPLAIAHAHAASLARFARKSLLPWLARCAACQTIFHLHGGGARQFATPGPSVVTRRRIRHALERSSRVIALTEGRAGFVRGFAPRIRTRVAQYYSTEAAGSRLAAIHNDLTRA